MSGGADKRRVGIVLSVFGIPSEIWALRQAEGFEGFEPVYFAESHAPGGFDLPAGRRLELFGARSRGFGGLLRRAERRLGLPGGALPPGRDLARMRARLLAADLDIVLCHFAWNAMAVAAALEGCAAPPVVCHVHGRDVTQQLRHPAYRRALARALPRFAHTVAVGSAQVRTLQGLCPGLPVSLIPCGAPLARFGTGPVPERAPGTPPVFVTVGRVSPEKGQVETLRAFRKVLETCPEARLVIVGDGPGRAALEAEIAVLGCAAQVELTGMLDAEGVKAQLDRAHVYVQHSRAVSGWVEGFGVTLVEAAAAGLPLVVSAQGGILDQVTDGENGLVFPAEDIAAQAACMARLIADETLRHRLGTAARQRAAHYDSALLTRRLEARLDACLPARAAARPDDGRRSLPEA